MIIKSQDLLYILGNIKKIWRRLHDGDVKCLTSVHQLDKISREFDDFSRKYEKILAQLVLATGEAERAKSLTTIISVIYYQEKVRNGLTTEKECSEMLTDKFFPAHLQSELRDQINSGNFDTENLPELQPSIIEKK